jgi:hypothetical protein
VGGQTLTCAIRRSGIRGLDLFLTTSSGFSLLGLGGWQVGQHRVCLGPGSVGMGPSRADGSRAGVAAASFDLSLTVLVDLMKQSQLYHYKSKRAECSLCNKMYTYSEDLFMTAFFTLMARGVPTMVLVAGGGVTPAVGAVPATAMVTDPVAKAAGSVPISWRSGSGGEAVGLQMENVSVLQY